jgi:hypothetical protein
MSRRLQLSDYEYISKRRLEQLEAQLAHRGVFGIAELDGVSVSAQGVGANVRRRKATSQFESELRSLRIIRRRLKRREMIGPIEGDSPFVEHELYMGFSLWSFDMPEEGERAKRTAALWYGYDDDEVEDEEEEGYSVFLIGNPDWLLGVPEGVIKGISVGSASADPSRGRAISEIHGYVQTISGRAAVEKGLGSAPLSDLEDPDLAEAVTGAMHGPARLMENARNSGRLPETNFSMRRFLAVPVIFAEGTLIAVPVYVATLTSRRR